MNGPLKSVQGHPFMLTCAIPKGRHAGMQRVARSVAAPTPFMQEAFADTTSGSRAQWKAAPPSRGPEACAANTGQSASVFKWGA